MFAVLMVAFCRVQNVLFIATTDSSLTPLQACHNRFFFDTSPRLPQQTLL
jgi:hypothetical protein